MLRPPVRICFVCSGNICRSPTAEVALRRIAERSDRDYLIAVDSAGTGPWHVDDDMDARARRTMTHAGYDVPAHRAKQFTAADLDERDVVVALDSGHHHALWWLATEVPSGDVDAARAKIVLLRDFDPDLAEGEAPDVPDPYYGDGFAEVLDQVERCCAVLLDAVERAVVDSDDRVHPPRREAR